jgi:hypothetical protein
MKRLDLCERDLAAMRLETTRVVPAGDDVTQP